MSQLDEQQVYDELVSLCYECVVDDQRWFELLPRLMEASERQQGGLMSRFERADFVQVSDVNFFNKDAVAPYNQYFCHQDPGHLFMPQRAVGHWYHDFLDYGPESIRRNTYYQEFHRDYGLGNISSLKLFETPTADAYLSLLTDHGAPLPSPRAQALLERLTRHLVSAGRLTERLHHMEIDLARRDLLLDHQRSPIWLLDGEARVLHCNDAAEHFLRRPDCPLYERNARLHGKHLEGRLLAMVRTAAGKQGCRQAGWLPLSTSGGEALLATPAPADAPVSAQLQRPLVVLVLLDNRPNLELFAELFGLTPAEQRLAEALARQLSPEQCATTLQLSINTVRSQLRALFRKTGTSRQAELASLISRLGN